MESFACSCLFFSLSTAIHSMLFLEIVCMEFGSRIQLNRWLKCLAQNMVCVCVFTGCDYVRCGNDIQLALLRIQAISKIHKFTYHIVIKNMCSNDKRPSFISIFLFLSFSLARSLCVYMNMLNFFIISRVDRFDFFVSPLDLNRKRVKNCNERANRPHHLCIVFFIFAVINCIVFQMEAALCYDS